MTKQLIGFSGWSVGITGYCRWRARRSNVEPCLVQASFTRALIVLQNRPGGSKVLEKKLYISLALTFTRYNKSIACFMPLICFLFFWVERLDGVVAWNDLMMEVEPGLTENSFLQGFSDPLKTRSPSSCRLLLISTFCICLETLTFLIFSFFSLFCLKTGLSSVDHPLKAGTLGERGWRFCFNLPTSIPLSMLHCF